MGKGKVAILEDDNTLASAMKTAFERSGFEVYVTSKTEEIQEYLHKNQVAALFVDCLLPSGSGSDFIEEIRRKFPPAVLDVVMMSGIFTESGVIKDIVRSTKAISFLKKPFDIKEALGLVKVKETMSSQVEEVSPRKALYLLFNKPKVSVREKRKTIEALEEIHGFDLPYLYSLLVETSASGHLNIVGGKGDVFGISFSDGKIIGVDIVDQETQLGKLLIEAGYIHPEDLKEGLSTTSNKKIGERLIHKNLLSPHAFNIALANQMSIRLSRTIVDMPIKVNFVATDMELTHPFIGSDFLSVFLHDWVASKIDFEWLKAHYTQWGHYTLAKSVSFDPSHPFLKMPLIAMHPGLVDFFTKGQTLNQLMDARKYPEETSYKALHLLLAKGLLVFADRSAKADDPEERLRTLKRLQAQFHAKNTLEIWDVLVGMAGGSDSEPQFVVSEFRKIIGAEPAPGQHDLMRVYHHLKQIADEALKFAQGGNRDQMKEEMAKQEIAMKIKAVAFFDEAKAALHKSQFAQAAGLLSKALSMDAGLEKIKLHMIWAKLGQADSQARKQQIIKDIEMELLQIPPEEKFDALYSYVMGLYQKAKGDFTAARKSFEKAYNLDSNFIAARREITSLLQKTQKKDALNMDLKDLVAGFFKKR